MPVIVTRLCPESPALDFLCIGFFEEALLRDASREVSSADMGGTRGHSSTATGDKGLAPRSYTYKKPSLEVAANTKGRIGLNEAKLMGEKVPLTPAEIVDHKIRDINVININMHAQGNSTQPDIQDE